MSNASPPGAGGKESLRTELAAARSKLTALHQEKEHLLMNMKELQAILDKERRELREVLGQAKAKIDSVNSEKKAVEARLSETEITVREQAARIKELEDLLRQLRAELNSGGSSMTAVASAVTFISGASAIDDVFSRSWTSKSREEPAITVLEPLVLKLRSVFQSETQCKSELLRASEAASEAQARHERELAALQRRLDEEIAARQAMETSCAESDARYQAVAKELAKNNQEIHSWRTEERLSMERQLAELRALLEASRGTIDELSQDRAQRDNRIVKLEHEVESLNKRLVKAQALLETANTELDLNTSDLERYKQESESFHNRLLAMQRDMDSMRDKHRAELSEAEKQHQEELARLRKLMNADESQVNKLKAEVMRLEHLVHELNGELDGSSSQLGSFKSRLDQQAESHKSEIHQLNMAHDALVAQLKQQKHELDSTIARLQAELAQSKQNHAASVQELQDELDRLRKKLARHEDDLQKADRLVKNQKTDFELEVQKLKSAAQQEMTKLENSHLTALSSLQNALNSCNSEKQELLTQAGLLKQSVSDANTTIVELREEIDQLRARLKDTAQQLAEAHAQLGTDRNSSTALASTIKQLELELEQLRRQLDEALSDLNKAQANSKSFKVGMGLESIERMIWTVRTMGFVTSFYQWKAEAHAMAMQRGANELADIVASVESDRTKTKERLEKNQELGGPSIDDWDINALDINAIAGEFGL
jgi:myosin protein heavy chain